MSDHPSVGVPARQPRKWIPRIRPVLAATLAAIALFTGAMLLTGSLVLAYRQAIDQTGDGLNAIAKLKTDQINLWMDDARSVSRLFLVSSEHQIATMEALQGSPESRASVGKALTSFVNAQETFEEFFLYGPEGVIIASSRPDNLGKVVRRQPYFASSMDGEYIQIPYFAVGTGLTALITRPIEYSDGRVAGVLAARLDLDTLARTMTDATGLGSTGETYLVSPESNYLLTPSRHEADGYPQQRAYSSHGIKMALSGHDGSDVYLDYRTPPQLVVGSYRWLPDLRVGLLAEIDLTEALEPFRRSRDLSMWIAGIAALLATLLGYFGSIVLSRPVERVAESARQLAQQTTYEQVKVPAFPLEMVELAHDFNTMASTLEERINELRSERAYVATLLDVVEVAILVADRDALILRANSHAEKLVLATEDARVPEPETGSAGMDWHLSTHEIQRFRQAIEESLGTGTKASVRLVTSHDDARTIDFIIVPFGHESGEVGTVVAAGTDVTDLLALERSLREAEVQEASNEKLQALGQLADAIGHEMQDALGTLESALLYLQLRGQRLTDAGRSQLDSAQEQLYALKSLSQELFDYTHAEDSEFQVSSLNAIVIDLLDHLTLPRHVRLATQLDHSIPDLPLDPQMIQGVVAHLISNAVDAMPEAGNLLIAVGREEEHVQLRVCDSGFGMPPEALEAVFEPAFTSKTGRLGLGMAIVHANVKAHGGAVGVESTVGKGTTVTVTLPWSEPPKR